MGRSAGRDFPALIERHHLGLALWPDPDLHRDQAGRPKALGVGGLALGAAVALGGGHAAVRRS